jgi:hypothetical protein
VNLDEEVLDNSCNEARYASRDTEIERETPEFDPAGQLVCITLYKRGVMQVVRRLGG